MSPFDSLMSTLAVWLGVPALVGYVVVRWWGDR